MKEIGRRTQGASGNLGLTLMELLIAISIFSIVILTIYSAFQTGILSYKKIDSAFEVYQTARIVLNRMELDLKNCFPYLEADSKFKGDAHSLIFFGIIDSYEKDNLYTDVCRIKYEIKDKVLIRAYYKGQDALKENPESPLEAGLSSAVREITFWYATGKANEPWQEIWPKEGDTHQKKALPLAVKIKLSLLEKGKPKDNVIEFNKLIVLPLSEKPRDE